MSHDRGDTLPAIAAWITWAAVTGFALFVIAGRAGEPSHLFWGAGILALLILGGVLLAGHDSAPRLLRLAALWTQPVSALAIGALTSISFVPIYTIIWIAMAADFYSPRTLWWLLAGLLLAWFAVYVPADGYVNAAIQTTLFGTFHLFALLSARSAVEADAARLEVESLNRELLATQRLLAQASRQGERTRIARELHDLLGHHLTALSINLQIAERTSDGETREKIGECRALARLLLSDVREAVSALRDDQGLDLEAAIRLIVGSTPRLDMRVDIEDALEIDDVGIAQTLLRCVQEGVTNTLRHADASECRIRIWQEDRAIHLEVSDDGRVQGEITEGNGLAGMRERLQALRGTLQLDRAGQALRLHATVPLPG
ncbi:sensor histidine kinase [Lentisalinibacter orientalis]|uniref:sensor histidine kinase n=1 Tax=Lentisalinibacter orientalis TaxID=2992241 RepID=UPI003870762F